MKKLPNILWICTEHQRYDTIAALGNEYIRTPNIDSLVKDGVAFTGAYCQNPVCTPSRVSFLSGMYPASCGIRQNGQCISDTKKPYPIVIKELDNMGYTCALVGKLHINAAGSGKEDRIDDGYSVFKWSHGVTKKHGGDWVDFLKDNGKDFDEVVKNTDLPSVRHVCERKLHQTTWCFDEGIKFVSETEGPWMLSVNPFAAHGPFDILDEFYEKYEPEDIPYPKYLKGEQINKPFYQSDPRIRNNPSRFDMLDEPDRKKITAAYYSIIEHLDFELGKLISHLKESGQYEDTLIIFNSDHGDMTGDHHILGKSCFFYEPAVRVPLIISWPEYIEGDRVSNGLVELVDIVPTIYDLLGKKTPSHVQGLSLAPILKGEKDLGFHKDLAYCEFYDSNGRHRMEGVPPAVATMVRNERYKVVVYHGIDTGELYDLKEDPNEFNNLWNMEQMKDKCFEMVKKCFDKSVDTRDKYPLRRDEF